MLKGSDEPCSLKLNLVTSRSGGLLSCVLYFILFFYSFYDYIMIKIFLSLRTIKYYISYNYYLDHNDGTCIIYFCSFFYNYKRYHNQRNKGFTIKIFLSFSVHSVLHPTVLITTSLICIENICLSHIHSYI